MINRLSKTFIGSLVIFLFSGCGIYTSYERPETLISNSFQSDVAFPHDSNSLSSLSWQMIFTDVKLQQLIDTALQRNSDLRKAQLQIDQAEASLLAARLAFVPSFSMPLQGGYSQYTSTAPQASYTLPVRANWQLDIFGSLHNARRQAKSVLLQTKAYEQAVKSNLIATVATHYYTLSMLHQQDAIAQNAVALSQETIRTMRLLYESGQYHEAAILQVEANHNRIVASQLEIALAINELENQFSVLLADTLRTIDTDGLAMFTYPQAIALGVPLQLLSSRPDVVMAEHQLAAAFYSTNQARSAFYPTVNLSGLLGWTNLAGVIANPGALLWEALGSVTQPIFQNGKLKAQLRIAKSQQDEAKINFQQTLLQAGVEVNNAFTQLQTYGQQSELYRQQAFVLQRSLEAMQLLMRGGSITYLELLTAQNSLLDAELMLVSSQFNEIAAFISLYQALGGGVN